MNTSLVETAGAIRESMADIARVDVLDDCLRVTTHCLYPSNGLVRVVVRVSGTTATVSDDRAALNEAQSAGLNIAMSDSRLRHVVLPYGATISNGTVFIDTSVSSAGAAIVFVANASRAVAEWLYTHMHIRPSRDFRMLLTDLLERKFESLVHRDVEIAGKYKKHTFANLVALPDGRRLLVDPVVPDASSVNSRVVAHLDVRNLNDETLEQRLIYDEADNWDSSNLSLLSIGANAIPFSRSEETLERIAAHA